MEAAVTVPSLPRSTAGASLEHEVVKSQPVTVVPGLCLSAVLFVLLLLVMFPRFCGSLILPTCPLHTNRSRSCNLN